MSGNTESPLSGFDIHRILEILPHRYPFLLVDRVLELEPMKRLVAIKNVTITEPFFQGHFPRRPVMPGVLIIEALAQATGLLALSQQPVREGNTTLYYFVGIDGARFKRVVEPGDQLRLVVEVKTVRRGIWVFNGIATVDGQVAAEAELMCTARDPG